MIDRVALVRSLSHSYPTHFVAYALSRIPENPVPDPRDDWPFYGSTLDYLWQQHPGTSSSSALPRMNSHSNNRSHRGLVSGWLGQQFELICGEFVGAATREQGFPSVDGSRAIRSRFDPFDGITPESTFHFTSTTYLEHASKVGLSHQFAKTGIQLPEDIAIAWAARVAPTI